MPTLSYRTANIAATPPAPAPSRLTGLSSDFQAASPVHITRGGRPVCPAPSAHFVTAFVPTRDQTACPPFWSILVSWVPRHDVLDLRQRLTAHFHSST
jgi:hypothetical protein